MSVTVRTLAAGDGWRVRDAICRNGPQDRPFEEQHSDVSVAAVTAGTFQYRTRAGRATLAPGALLLGNAGACFECGHAHAAGDRCLAFHFAPSFFDAVASDVPGSRSTDFRAASVPANDALIPLFADAQSTREETDAAAFEELAWRFAGAALTLQSDVKQAPSSSARDERRITAAARRIERDAEQPLSLAALAREAGMSAYHFLRTFRRVVGMTPHHYILRTRLVRAALGLRRSGDAITTVALEAGFNDLSTFNRRFARLMGVTPGVYRARFQAGR